MLRAAGNDVSILDLVKLADDLILDRTSKVHATKKGLSKGIAFPTTINRNHTVGHFAPMEKDQEQPTLATGDIVKVTEAAGSRQQAVAPLLPPHRTYFHAESERPCRICALHRI